MIEDDLRKHYANVQAPSGAEERIYSALASATRPPSTNSGRRLRIIASAACVALIAVAVAVLPRHHDAHRNATPIVPEASASTPLTTTAPTAAKAQTLVTTTPQVLVSTLAALITGKGHLVSPAGKSVGPEVLAQVTYDDGAGLAEMTIVLTVAGARPCSVPDLACTTRPDGSAVQTVQSLEYPNAHANNATEWSVEVYQRAGYSVELSEWNAPTSKDSALSRATPPFSIAELTTMATSPSWTISVPKVAADAVAGLFTPDAVPGEAPSTS